MESEERDDPYKVPKSAQAAKPQKQHSLKSRHNLVVFVSAFLTGALTIFVLSVTGLGDAMMAAINGLIGR